MELPLALALVAGAVAAFNPCGFALLPAYLVLLVADGPDGASAGTSAQVWRAVRFSAAMTAGFVAVFGFFGAVVARLSLSVEKHLPAVTVGIGIVLVGLGAWALVRGGKLPGIGRLSRAGRAPTSTLRSQLVYGVGFALASLSCTVGPFLAVTGTAARTGDTAGVLLTFVVYALGMGAVVSALAMAVALARGSVVTRMRRATPWVERLGAVLLVVAGAYVTWYGWFEIRVLAGSATGDPVVDAATGVQAEISRFVSGLGAGVLSLVAVAVVAVVAALAVSSRRAGRAAGRGQGAAGRTPVEESPRAR